MKEFTISFCAYAGVTLEAETLEEALDLFLTDEGQEAAYKELACSCLEITDITEEGE